MAHLSGLRDKFISGRGRQDVCRARNKERLPHADKNRRSQWLEKDDDSLEIGAEGEIARGFVGDSIKVGFPGQIIAEHKYAQIGPHAESKPRLDVI